jgi:hypothetical protein
LKAGMRGVAVGSCWTVAAGGGGSGERDEGPNGKLDERQGDHAR